MQEAPRALHSVREDAYNYVWDNSLDPALEVEPDDTVELHVRDASDEQIDATSCGQGPCCTSPSASKARSSRSGTPTQHRATARSAAPRSRRRWTSSSGCRCGGTSRSTHRSTACRRELWRRTSRPPTTSTRGSAPT